VLRLLARNEGLGITRDELVDRYLMTKTLQQVIGEITQALHRLTALGYVVTERNDGSAGPFFRINPERETTVRRLMAGGGTVAGASETQTPAGESQTNGKSPGRRRKAR
jgi:hypothetical protein